jgi:hypothetical protein
MRFFERNEAEAKTEYYSQDSLNALGRLLEAMNDYSPENVINTSDLNLFQIYAQLISLEKKLSEGQYSTDTNAQDCLTKIQIAKQSFEGQLLYLSPFVASELIDASAVLVLSNRNDREIYTPIQFRQQQRSLETILKSGGVDESETSRARLELENLNRFSQNEIETRSLTTKEVTSAATKLQKELKKLKIEIPFEIDLATVAGCRQLLNFATCIEVRQSELFQSKGITLKIESLQSSFDKIPSNPTISLQSLGGDLISRISTTGADLVVGIQANLTPEKLAENLRTDGSGLANAIQSFVGTLRQPILTQTEEQLGNFETVTTATFAQRIFEDPEFLSNLVGEDRQTAIVALTQKLTEKFGQTIVETPAEYIVIKNLLQETVDLLSKSEQEKEELAEKYADEKQISGILRRKLAGSNIKYLYGAGALAGTLAIMWAINCIDFSGLRLKPYNPVAPRANSELVLPVQEQNEQPNKKKSKKLSAAEIEKLIKEKEAEGKKGKDEEGKDEEEGKLEYTLKELKDMLLDAENEEKK